jgi:hypothetical protein
MIFQNLKAFFKELKKTFLLPILQKPAMPSSENTNTGLAKGGQGLKSQNKTPNIL